MEGAGGVNIWGEERLYDDDGDGGDGDGRGLLEEKNGRWMEWKEGMVVTDLDLGGRISM